LVGGDSVISINSMPIRNINKDIFKTIDVSSLSVKNNDLT